MKIYNPLAMKIIAIQTPFIRCSLLLAVISLALSFSPIRADDNTDMLNKALDLVHQAWNPAGDPPSDAQRTDLLNQALKLAQAAPDHHLKKHRVQAILDIKAALTEIQGGDADHKAADYMQDADSELRTAISIAQ